jgi:hypothetical protein
MNRLATFFEKPARSRRAADDWKPLLSFTNLCLVQGLYYLLMGLWPLLNLDGFEAVTGPKTDRWLVRTVGLLVAVEAAVLLLAAWRRQATPEVALLAIGSALALTAVDVFCTLSRTIAPIYLLDAVAEVLLIACWVRLLLPENHAVARPAFGLPKHLHELSD